MAGRPVNKAHREKRKREVDATIAVIKKRNQPVTKKAIAEEMGLTVQSFYVSGFLSQYVKELEQTGIIVKERGNSAGVTTAEAKALRKKVSTLKKENDRLKEKVAVLEQSITEMNKKVTNLNEQLEIERGNTFLKQKHEFAQRRI